MKILFFGDSITDICENQTRRMEFKPRRFEYFNRY